MGQSVDVVVSELHSAATRLAAAGQRLQDGLSSVDLEVGQLLGSGWRGDAASAYGTAWDQWHSGAGQVVRGLQAMSDLLTIAGKEYAKMDEQGAQAIGSAVQAAGGTSGGAANARTGERTAGATSGGGGASAPSSGSAAAQQAVSVVGQVVAGLAQAGPAAAGVAQQAASLALQMAAGLAQEAGGNEPGVDDRSAEERGDDERETDPEAEAVGAAAGDASAGAAPVKVERPAGEMSLPAEGTP